MNMRTVGQARAQKMIADQIAEAAAYEADCKEKDICPKCQGEGGEMGDEVDCPHQVWYACYSCGETGKYFSNGRTPPMNVKRSV